MNKTPAVRFNGFKDDWEKQVLKTIANVIDGDRGNNYPTESDFMTEGHTLFLNASNVTKEGFLFSNNQYISEKKSNSMGNGKLQEDDIIVTSRGSLGHIAWYNADTKRIINHARINSGMLILRKKEAFDSSYLNQFMKSYKGHKQIIFISFGSAQPQLTKTDVEKLNIDIPRTIKEQARIGSFLYNLDNLIALHQRKYEKLINLKKSMLYKMFPQNGSKVPEIRFKGFTGDWEQRKLGNIATFINGRAYSQPELLFDGKYKVLRVGNFYTNDLWYYSDLELGEKFYANYGDLLYTWSATFGPHIWLGDKVIYHYHIWKIDLSDQLEKNFAVQLLEQDKDNILSSKNGSTMVHITKEGMEQKEVIIPSDTAEQEAIGVFFGKLDDIITLHQRKLDKLKQLKQAMLHKMFV